MTKARAGGSSSFSCDNLDGVKDPGAYAVEKFFAVLVDKFF